MLNSITNDTTTVNAFIFRNEARFNAIDTDTINESGIDTGDTIVRFDVPTGTNVAGAVHAPWRISPDVITSDDDGRAYYYHYGIIADSIGPCGPSGLGEILGNDLIIALGCGFDNIINATGDENNNFQPQSVGSTQQQQNTLMHELGHNLDLLHGGPRINVTTGLPILDSEINCKPNYDSTMSYTHQSTTWLPSGYTPHFSSGFIQDIDETALPPEALGLQSDQLLTDEHRRIVFAAATGAIKTDRVTPTGGTPNLVNWDGTGFTNPAPGPVDVNFIAGLTGCEASPGEFYEDHDDWNSLNLICQEKDWHLMV